MKRKHSLRRSKPKPHVPDSDIESQLYRAFSLLESEQDYANFLRDLLSTAEITEFANRLEIARLLIERDKSYLEIAELVGTSTTTVTRVAQWLFRGCGGYNKVLRLLDDE